MQQHSQIAMDLLVAKIQSRDANIRANAYEFIGYMIEVPDCRKRAVALLEVAEKTEGLAIQNTVRPFLNKVCSSPASR